MSLDTLIEEKELFLKGKITEDLEMKFNEFKNKIIHCDRIEYDSLIESSKHHDFLLRLKNYS